MQLAGLQACRVCGGHPKPVGYVRGRLVRRNFGLARCASCGYGFVIDPETDLDAIYTPAYYRGQGADPLVDYLFELEDPERSIRVHEWRGVVKLVDSLVTGGVPGARWLDFGCGAGGLIRYASNRGTNVVGFDQGWIVERARAAGIPILDDDELDRCAKTFDVVTAIEVLEHIADPLDVLGKIRRLLRPGGLFFYTTGNAEPYADRLAQWRYVVPEIHVSFFEPRTLELALRKTGFRPETGGMRPGYAEIIKFKVLKNLRVRRSSLMTDLLPATPLAALADRRARVTAHPIAWAV